MNTPTELLTTMLIGNNGVNIASTTLVAYVGVHLADLNGWNLVMTGTVMSVLITFTIIVFGEVVPKIIARSASVRMATLLIVPLFFIDKLMRPFTWVLVKTMSRMMHKVGSAATDSQVTEEDIKQMMEMGEQAGNDPRRREGNDRLHLPLQRHPVNKVMISRTQMVCVDINTNLDQLVDIIILNGYSRMPIYKGTGGQHRRHHQHPGSFGYLEEPGTDHFKRLGPQTLFRSGKHAGGPAAARVPKRKDPYRHRGG